MKQPSEYRDVTLEPKKVKGKKDLKDAVESEEEVMVEL